MSAIPAHSGNIPTSFYQDFLEDSSNFNENALAYSVSARAVALHVAQAALFKFGAIALFQPFESARLLRQVQHGTAIGIDGVGGFCESLDGAHAKDHPRLHDSGTSNDADDESDALFPRQRLASEARIVDGHLSVSSNALPIRSKPSAGSTLSTDTLGYITSLPNRHTSPSPAPANSRWPLILNKRASLWASLAITAKYHGVTSLWNGVFAFWAYQVAFDVTRGTLEELLASQQLWSRPGGLLGYVCTFPDSIPSDRPSFPTAPIISSVLLQSATALLLTPLDIARTRLVAQSVFPSETKCTSLPATLAAMYREEGGLGGLYPHRLLALSSALLVPALRIIPSSLFAHFGEAAIETLGIPSGVAYALAQFVFNCVQLTVTMPLETIRRRLHLQSIRSATETFRGKNHRPWTFRVPVSPVPYTGFCNCLRRICQEEGIGALYQGWSMQLATSSVILASTLLLELENEYPDEMEAF